MHARPTMLSYGTMSRVIDEAYLLLANRGIDLHNEQLVALLSDHGCRVDMQKKHVWISQALTEKCLESCPRQVVLHDIHGTPKFVLSGSNIHFTPGSAAIKVLDPASNKIRLATLDDMLSYTKLVKGLKYVSYPSTAVVPNDVPAEHSDSIRLFALLLSGDKPIVTGAFSPAGFEVMKELQLAVRGTEEEMVAKPMAIFSCCPGSPLKWSLATSSDTAECAKLGIPVEFISMPLPGMSSPMTLVGSLIQHTAETLSGIVISQCSRPGAPILYGGSPCGFDMRHTTACIGSLEAQMLNMGAAQMGKFLRLPTQAYIGLSDSKSLDAQAGHETGTGLYLGALAGINSMSGPGMLMNESCMSLEKLAMDDDLCGMAKRLVAGFEMNEDEDFSFDELFGELLENHDLLGSAHTVKHMRSEHFIPSGIISRTAGDSESMPLTERAQGRVHAIIATASKIGNGLDKEKAKDLCSVMVGHVGDAVVEKIKKSLLP